MSILYYSNLVKHQNRSLLISKHNFFNVQQLPLLLNVEFVIKSLDTAIKKHLYVVIFWILFSFTSYKPLVLKGNKIVFICNLNEVLLRSFLNKNIYKFIPKAVEKIFILKQITPKKYLINMKSQVDFRNIETYKSFNFLKYTDILILQKLVFEVRFHYNIKISFAKIKTCLRLYKIPLV